MRKIFPLSGILFVALIPAAAHADLINTFSLSTTTEDGAVQGILEIDATKGFVGYGQFTINLVPPAPGLAAQTFHLAGNFTNFGGTIDAPNNRSFSLTDKGETLYLEVPNSLVGYFGGPLCGPPKGNCSGLGEGSLFVATDSAYYGGSLEHLKPANFVLLSSVVTPEPQSLVLTGSGIVGLAGLARRRWRQLGRG